MMNEGDKRAEIAIDLINDPNKFLSTIQIFITLISIFAGTFGGATIAQRLNEYLIANNLLQPYSGLISIVSRGSFNYLFDASIIGELVPKRIAIDYSENISVRVARPAPDSIPVSPHPLSIY